MNSSFLTSPSPKHSLFLIRLLPDVCAGEFSTEEPFAGVRGCYLSKLYFSLKQHIFFPPHPHTALYFLLSEAVYSCPESWGGELGGERLCQRTHNSPEADVANGVEVDSCINHRRAALIGGGIKSSPGPPMLRGRSGGASYLPSQRRIAI